MKNWIVEIEQKKRMGNVSERTKRRNKTENKETKKANKNTLENAIKYLLSDKHQNHSNTKIIDLDNARFTRDNIYIEYDNMKKKHGKGVSNIATSFVLSLPSDLYHPTKNEWQDIYNEMIDKFVSAINKDLEKKQLQQENINPNDLNKRQLKEYELNQGRYKQRLNVDYVKKLSTAVIHDDREKPLIVGATSGSHLNVIMSNIFNGEVIKYISQKGGVLAMKNAYSEAVKNRLGLDCEKYIPYDSRPDDNKLKDFYLGESKVDILVLDENTPHKNKIIKKEDEPKNVPLWVHRKEQGIKLQAEKDKIEKEKKAVVGAKEKVVKAKETILTAQSEVNERSASLDAQKELYIEFQEGFIEYVGVLAENRKEDHQYSVGEKFFDTELQANIEEKITNEKVKKPWLLEMKEYLSDLFSKVFKGKENRTDELLEFYNKGIEQDEYKIKRKNKTYLRI
ncbi:hypothetical protein [Vibrio sp. V15_P4S5T153]|uniref:hypothetical protein n=3 Tax=unclassified Vibrio TaxID=2614977 RepID=UPI000B8F62FD|nr:hypothetical protein [Vibrio sp. V15_P4S5T153]OXX63633.1 hypothetical protein B9J89_07150 [Vibrio sp. V15_P4S5T153]